MKNPTKTKRLVFIIFLSLMYIGLPLLIMIGWINFEYKFYALTVGGLLVYCVFRVFGFSNTSLGITYIGTKQSILTVLPLTILLTIVGILIWTLGFSRMTPNENWCFFAFYVFISSPVQEFLYRGALVEALNFYGIRNSGKMFLSSLVYSFVHIIYGDLLTLVLTFAVGLIWYHCYQKRKNLIGVSISHAVLGIVTIITGIIN